MYPLPEAQPLLHHCGISLRYHTALLCDLPENIAAVLTIPLYTHTHTHILWQKRKRAPNAKAGTPMFLSVAKSSAAIADMMKEPQRKYRSESMRTTHKNDQAVSPIIGVIDCASGGVPSTGNAIGEIDGRDIS
jgi:hypothetical protein